MNKILEGFINYNRFNNFTHYLRREHNISLQEVMILETVYKSDEPVNKQKLEDETGITPTSAAPYITQLKKAKLIKKDRDEENERYLILLKREDAEDKVKELIETVQLAYDDFMNPYEKAGEPEGQAEEETVEETEEEEEAE